MSIKLLPPRLANQIAAGEVVERPASVVKELVENSLDAGATRIELDVERGGHKRIRLRDNGSGIVKDELELALSRHATSKIATLDDLEQILSLGFRGEALASISAVSRLTLTSKPATQEQAWQASCEGRDMAVTLQPAAHPDGTTIDVADIFYNTPARRKFLRTEKTEYQHIEDVIKRIALSRPDVTFILRHNDKVTKRYAATGTDQLAVRVGQVCGKAFIEQAIHTRCDYESIQLEAWLGNAEQLRSSNDCQYSFVNGRGMRDKLILHALRQAYESVLAVAEQPAFVVYLTINPKEVDVNVHPAKHEVRFQQSRLVHDFICKTVCDALSSWADPEGQDDNGAAWQPDHDYIRPLERRESHQHEQAPHYHSPGEHRASASQYAGGGTPRNTGLQGRSPRSSGSRVSGQYQQHYQALMTPASNESDESAESFNYLMLGETRLYSLDEACVLLTPAVLMPLWVAAMLSAETVAQPLLMPVTVHASVAESTLSTLTAAGFEVSMVAGKARLMKVPANLRSLPWAGLFPLMLDNAPASNEQLTETLTEGLLAQQSKPVFLWQWFEQLALSQQTDIIKRNGDGVARHKLIQWIQKEVQHD
ncbi:DNA mismatch repair endonuclease MutL [Alteromonas gilva]|uniref:DNA mismatch repair protein MutL n=1 Tax=Alteromonas gilva TaxID=2987522 RepID=A0ABT5L0A7_9ALTE|nr:DNA mismatch repair endonuclease MutL [Alteromonas gilva]MDC8829866.1 DNA mismatch repair endonuclease MutL [Alteromonas gilva]